MLGALQSRKNKPRDVKYITKFTRLPLKTLSPLPQQMIENL